MYDPALRLVITCTLIYSVIDAFGSNLEMVCFVSKTFKKDASMEKLYWLVKPKKK